MDCNIIVCNKNPVRITYLHMYTEGICEELKISEQRLIPDSVNRDVQRSRLAAYNRRVWPKARRKRKRRPILS
jgi:hypothetical protein